MCLKFLKRTKKKPDIKKEPGNVTQKIPIGYINTNINVNTNKMQLICDDSDVNRIILGKYLQRKN